MSAARFADAGSRRAVRIGQSGDRRGPRRGRCRPTKPTSTRRSSAARKGFAVWSAMTGAERGRVLRRAADILRARNEELAELETRDTGKPIQETIASSTSSPAPTASNISPALAATLAGEHIDLGPPAFGYTRREPLGVVAGIGAWNYPLQIACWKAAPALACGNAMIFKPAELTPLTARQARARSLTRGRAPGRRLQRRAGLCRHRPAADAPSGDPQGLADRRGRHRPRRSWPTRRATLKHVTLELGGKSPLIVFDDAKLDNAVSGALLGNFYSAGEVCSNGTRVFVHAQRQGRVPRQARRARRAHDRSATRSTRRPRSAR